MARSVLMTFTDNAVSEQFVRDMAVIDRDGRPFVPAGVTIDAVVARPTLWCKCTGHMKKDFGYKGIPKFGWWVHARCQRPTKHIVDHWLENHLNGCVNLLEGILNKGKKAA